MVEEAIAVAATNGFTNVTGKTCDVQDLPFGNGRFDLVVANHMLCHVPNPDLAIGEAARVMKPEGLFTAATNGFGHMDVMKDVLEEVAKFRTLRRLWAKIMKERFGCITVHQPGFLLMLTGRLKAIRQGLNMDLVLLQQGM